MSKTASLFKRFSILREYKVISKLSVEVENKKYTFDELLIGEFGVLCAVTFNKKGDLYGNENDENFVLIDKKMRREICENLIKKAQKGEMILRKIFANEKVYNVKIDNIAVIENQFCQRMVSVQKGNLLDLKETKKYLNSGKFDLDNKTDKDKIIETITKYKI